MIFFHNSEDFKEALVSPTDLPTIVGGIWRYFDCVYPNGKGGPTYPGVRFAFVLDRDTLQASCEHDLRKSSINMWYNTIQHHTTVNSFWLQNFNLDSNLKYWTEFFEESITAQALLEQYNPSSPQANTKILIECHPANDRSCHTIRESPHIWSTYNNINSHV